MVVKKAKKGKYFLIGICKTFLDKRCTLMALQIVCISFVT